MARYFCYGKDGLCESDNDCKSCARCKFFNGSGGIYLDNEKGLIACIKRDVEREIFEEVEEIFNKRIAFYTDMAKQSKFTEKHYAETMIKNCEIYLQEIAELKNKHTEGEFIL